MTKIDQAILNDIVIEVKKDALNRGYELSFPIKGRSMLPLLMTNNRIIVARCRPEDYRPGDIVLYQVDGDNMVKLIAHRLIRKIRDGQRYLFITKGDACFGCDRPIPSDMVLGRIKMIKKFGLIIPFDTLPGRCINNILFLFSISRLMPFGISILRKMKLKRLVKLLLRRRENTTL